MRGGWSMKADHRIDVRGEACPMPVILTRDKLREMRDGEILEVTTDFPASRDNIRKAVTREGHEVLGVTEEDGSFKIYIRKKG